MPELIFTIFFGAVSVLALIYYILLMFVIGFAFNFTLFWPVLSAVCAFAAVSCRMVGLGLWHIRPGVWIPLAVIGVTVLAVIIYLEIVIVSAAFRPTAQNAPYCIVLGCRVNGDRPSLALRYRIEAAAEYLKDNPETTAIVSGGQGPDEEISEAQCMRDELVKAGIEPERIIMEEVSTSTTENIQFSMDYIEDLELPVVIITSEYHVYRGMEIARKAGLVNVSGLRANPGPIMGLHYYVREAFAVLKDFIVGNL